MISFDGISQEFTLKLISKNKVEQIVLDKIEYQKKFKNPASIQSEIEKIADQLKNFGYFTNTIDSVKNTNNNYNAFFTLNDLIEKAIIKIDSIAFSDIKTIVIKNNSFSIPINQLQNTLNEISNSLDNQGKSFSKIHLENIIIKNKTLFADLKINL